jgi:hypothetical protein
MGERVNMYLLEYTFQLNPRPDPPLDRALHAAERAVTADPADQAAHAVLTIIHYHRREFERSMTEAEQALALNPNNTPILACVGMHLVWSGSPVLRELRAIKQVTLDDACGCMRYRKPRPQHYHEVAARREPG